MLWTCTLICMAAAPVAAQYDDFGGDVPYVPTPPAIVEAMLKLGKIQSGDFVIDLGCGDGRIVVMAAEKFGARGMGYDLNPERISEANENAKKAGVTDKVKFEVKNLFEAEIAPASLVTLYLLPDVNLRLRPRLLRDLKLGTRIVSHSFNMGDWQPDQKIEINGKTLYFWEVTEKARAQFGEGEKIAGVDGAWVYTMPTPNGELSAALTLKTEGEKLTGGFMFEGNRKLEITDGTVNGSELKFTVKRDRQSGGTLIYQMTAKVNGDTLDGKTTAEMDGQKLESTWSAKRK